jgi:hypothetical protein
MVKYLIFFVCSTAGFASQTFAQFADTALVKPKPIGAVLRTVREIDMTNDTIPEILQIETSKAKRVRNIKVRFAIYSRKKVLYSHSWKADDFFDAKDHLSDTIKWFRLQRIMRGFFSNQNFSTSDSEDIGSICERLRCGDILPVSEEAKEYAASSHEIFSIYAGRDMLYGITWLGSKKKFVTLWRN